MAEARPHRSDGPDAPDPRADDEAWRRQRDAMVDQQIAARGVSDPRVLAALRAVPRHRFAPEMYASESYEDHPVALGFGQTLSQPYIVALMSELVAPRDGERVLEVGAGSGYQTAVLAELVGRSGRVVALERIEPLASQAEQRLLALGHLAPRGPVVLRVADGARGVAQSAAEGPQPSSAPGSAALAPEDFDVIVVACAAPAIPPPLLAALAPGGRLVMPVGPPEVQALTLVTRGPHGLEQREVLPVRFVPLVTSLSSSA